MNPRKINIYNHVMPRAVADLMWSCPFGERHGQAGDQHSDAA